MLSSIQKKSNESRRVKLVKKAKVLIFKRKSVSKKLVVKPVKTVSVAPKMSPESEEKAAPKPEKTPNLDKTGQKTNKLSEMDAEVPGNVLKKIAEREKPSYVTIDETNQGKENIPKTATVTKLGFRALTNPELSVKAVVEGQIKTMSNPESTSGNLKPHPAGISVEAPPAVWSPEMETSQNGVVEV